MSRYICGCKSHMSNRRCSMLKMCHVHLAPNPKPSHAGGGLQAQGFAGSHRHAARPSPAEASTSNHHCSVSRMSRRTDVGGGGRSGRHRQQMDAPALHRAIHKKPRPRCDDALAPPWKLRVAAAPADNHYLAVLRFSKEMRDGAARK